MSYDADHRRRILEEVRSACLAGRFERAVKLLQQGVANLSYGKRRIPVRHLRSALGAGCADRLIKWCTVRPCMYCKGGREVCEECRGTGMEQGSRICRECGGFGSCRCPFCNGTSFAGYDFVPAGLRVVVMSGRVRLALARIAGLRRRNPAETSDLGKLIGDLIDLDRCRGVVANACERVRMGDETTPGAAVFSHTAAVRLESACRAANARAEAIIRRHLRAIAGHALQRAGAGQRPSSGARVSRAQAEFWEKLSARPNLAPSAIETPAVFRAD